MYNDKQKYDSTKVQCEEPMSLQLTEHGCDSSKGDPKTEAYCKHDDAPTAVQTAFPLSYNRLHSIYSRASQGHMPLEPNLYSPLGGQEKVI